VHGLPVNPAPIIVEHESAVDVEFHLPILHGGRPARSVTVATWDGSGSCSPWRCIVGGERGLIAFNPADEFAIGGIFVLVVVIGDWRIRNRDLIPPSAEVRSRGRDSAGSSIERSLVGQYIDTA